MTQWHCPWCGAAGRGNPATCPVGCGWSAAGHSAALVATEVRGVFYAATGSNPARARESLAMALHRDQLDPGQAAEAVSVAAPDAGPWSFRWSGGPYVDVSRPGAVEVDVVDMWDEFDFDWVRVEEVTEFLRLCRRWLGDWAERYERDGD